MRVLILGGTRFLGRALVEAALLRGDQVTLFNRGLSSPGLFEGRAELRAGERDGSLETLVRPGQDWWDVVIDTSGYVPRVVGKSAQLLKDHAERYVFISSISVYEEPPAHGVSEQSPTIQLEDEATEEVNAQTYGGLKALCEREVDAHFGEQRALHVRAGLIVGPYDLTDRFTYWPWRVRRGGRVLAPGSPEHPVQWIDVRDLARWTLEAAAAKASGPYNVTGPAQGGTMGELLTQLSQALRPDVELSWVPESFLLEHQVQPWADLPVWTGRQSVGMARVDISRAKALGLTTRDIAQTAHDTLAWFDRERANAPGAMAMSLPASKEESLLAAWDSAEDGV